jgi:hypothetical protein
MTHFRSADTKTAVSYSRAELERILNRYGCTRFGHDQDREAQRIAVWFTVPDSKVGTGEFIPVRLEVSLRDVQRRLEAYTRRAPEPAQVERVAWRHIVLLVEAGLIASEAGIKRISEFFLADTVVTNERGERERFIQALEAREPTWKALLTSGYRD